MTKKGIISTILWMMIICSCFSILTKADEKVITISATKSAQTTDVVLVIDNSGSMNTTDPINKGTNESVGTQATKMFINSTPLNGSKIGIVSFSAQLSDPKFRTESLLNTDEPGDRNKLIQYVDAIKSQGRNGGTNIPAGISEAIRMLSQSKTDNKAIILITDGENDPSRDTVDPWVNDSILKGIKDNIPIYIIGLKAGVPEEKKEAFKNYLQKISKSNERVFTLDSTDSIAQVVQEIDAMAFKAEKIIEFPVGEISLDMPANVKTCAMSFASINNKNINISQVKDTKNQDITNNKEMVYCSSIGSTANLTLTTPEKGLWSVMVKGEEGDRVRIEWKVTTNPNEPKPTSTNQSKDLSNKENSINQKGPTPNKIPWGAIIIILIAISIVAILYFILYDKKLPSLPGYMKVLLKQPDGSLMVIQDWLELGTIKNTAKKPITLGTISGMKELDNIVINQGDYDYEITLKGQLPSNIYGLQNGLNTDDSCVLIYEDGKQIEFTYKSFLC